MEDFNSFREYLTDDELAKIAPMVDRLSVLEDRKEREDNF